MKITFLILCLEESGGAERAVCSLSGMLAERGNEVSIAVLCGNSSFYPINSAVKVKYLSLPPLPSFRSPSWLPSFMSRARSVRSTVRALSPDFVIGMSHIMSAYAVFSSAFTGIKAIGSERSNPYILNASTAITLLRKVTSLLCDGYVFQTKAAQDFFPRRAAKKSAVIPNAIFNDSVLASSPPTVREHTITAAGRLVECKGFDVLIDAFSRLPAEFSDFKLLIMGSGEQEERLREIAEEKSVSDRVLLPGSVSDITPAVSSSSAFVLSSRYEGMPNALIEAMACGVPCVATRCRMGPEELICDGENGLLVPVDDAAAMSDAIRAILSDKNLSERLSRNALTVRRKLSPDAVTDRWTSYLLSIL